MKFVDFNKNPKQWKREGDCVIRAISVAESKGWKETYQELVEIGLKHCRVINSKQNYEKLLKEHGWVKHKQPKHLDNSKYSIRTLIEEHPNELLIISTRCHLTVAVKGSLVDTWNCSNKYVHNYYTNEYYNSIIDKDEFVSKEIKRVLL